LSEALAFCRPHLVAALAFSALINLLYLAPTLYMLQVYDRVVQSGSTVTLALLSLVLVGALALTVILDRLRQKLLLLAGVRLDRIFAHRLFKARLNAPVASGRLAPVMREFDALRNALTGPVILTVFDAPWIGLYVAALFLVHWSLGLFAILACALLLGLAAINEWATHGFLERAARAQAENLAALEDIDRSIGAARALGMGSVLARRLERSRLRTNAPQIEAADANAGISGLIRFLRLFFQSAALGMGAWLVIHKMAGPSAIFAGSMLMGRALAPVDQAVAHWRALQMAQTAWVNLKTLFAKPYPASKTALDLSASPRLEVEGLTLVSPTREHVLLRNITFAAGGVVGGLIGVIGPSGSGKSLLLECLVNARRFDQGEVRLDGARLSDWDVDRLGARVGFLPQDVQLLPGTVKQNISRLRPPPETDPEATDRAVIEAAKKVGAHEMILALPQGYDTEISGRGLRLSAGQTQLIGLARALYGNPSFVVLDEPNAHLDGDAERSLLSALALLRREGALVVASGHRMPLHQIADVIAVVRGGELQMFGPTPSVFEILRAQVRPAPTVAEAANG